LIDLYLKKVFSTRACWWYPDSFFHRRRPTFLTRLTVRSRALSRFDLVAAFLGGLRWAIGYEVRPWESRRTGFFAKAGSLHVYSEGDADYGFATGGGDTFTAWGHSGRLSLGTQHQFTDVFSLSFELGVSVPEPFAVGKLGLTFAF